MMRENISDKEDDHSSNELIKMESDESLEKIEEGEIMR